MENVIEQAVEQVTENAVEGTTDVVVAEAAKNGLTLGQKVVLVIGGVVVVKYVVVPVGKKVFNGGKKLVNKIKNRKAKNATYVVETLENEDVIQEA